jgi:hypothetical protein
VTYSVLLTEFCGERSWIDQALRYPFAPEVGVIVGTWLVSLVLVHVCGSNGPAMPNRRVRPFCKTGSSTGMLEGEEKRPS